MSGGGRVWAAGLALIALAAAHGGARAQGYGPGEAAPRREGFLFGFAIGPSIFAGQGALDGKNGVGGDLNLRVGTSASESFLWLVELQGGGYLVDRTTEAGTERIFNQHATLTLGGQLYARETLWLRFGAGVAGFHESEGRNGPEREGTRKEGVAVIAGGGYDMFRRGIFACDLELILSAAAFDGAFLGHGGIQLGLVWY